MPDPDVATPDDAECPTLYLDYIGEQYALDGGQLTFGRSADLCIDDENRNLHRIAGAFEWRAGHWWLVNLGSSVTLDLLDAEGPGKAVLAAGQSQVIGFCEFLVRFVAGPTTYQITGSGDLAVDRSDDLRRTGTDLDDDTTIQWGPVDLNPEQKLLLVAMAQYLLRAPSDAPYVPPAKEVAAQLDWSMPKHNRKLDHLCIKLGKAGVRGLRGGSGDTASTRRLRLAQHAVEAKLVTRADLDLLPGGV